MMTIVTHAVALLAGFGGGWYCYSKWVAKVKAVEAALTQKV